jgi:demethylmenaquinone methyltransferase/2-methoxy-6-polyprenyl-1,4-benzoquinol methylase
MPNEFYDPGAGRAAKVNALFTRIARRYDLLNDLQSFGFHRLWKKRLLDLAGIACKSLALDVCCGTGDLVFALAARDARVVGLDFTAAMLAVAEERKAHSASQAGRNALFIQGDAQSLPFMEGEFDVVTVAYGLRNLARWQQGLREMARVARPGGKLLVLDFGKPENPAWRWLYFTYLRLFVPVLGLVFCGSAGAYAYILESLKHYPAQKGVAEEMSRLGFKNVRIHNVFGGVMSINYGEKAPPDVPRQTAG